MNAIPGELQHAIVIADTDKKKRNVERNTCIWENLLKDEIRKLYEEKVSELVSIGAIILWGHFKNSKSM